ncbi:MAG: HD domain-containing protein [Lachnospiraceae bacterium]|nr:HD domain-containing protein [Lachnospiraceae bacterium]
MFRLNLFTKKGFPVFLCIMLGIFCFGSVPVLAGPNAAGEEEIKGSGAGYTATLFDGTNGLPTSDANAIVQTPDGFIWIGNYSGLIRYDGTSFFRYDASNGISSVVSLFVDSKERVWIGTNDCGVLFFDHGEFHAFSREEDLMSSSIRSIEEDSDGNILIATTQGLAYVDSENELHAVNDPQLNGKYICELQNDGNGIIYGEMLSGDFFSIEDLRVSSYFNGSSLNFGAISCIYPDTGNPGYIYLGTEESNIFYGSVNDGMKNARCLNASPETSINRITRLGSQLWVCADNGIGYFDSEDHYVSLENIPMNNSVDDIIEDYEGNLWFVSSRQGVMKISRNQFRDLFLAAKLPDMVVNSTCLYHDDLFIGTDSGLVCMDKYYNVKETELTDYLKDIRIRCIKSDSKDNLWLSTYGEKALVLMRPDGSIQSFTETEGLLNNRVRSTEELSDGSIAVATSGGVNILKDEKIIAAYSEEDGIHNTEILSMAEGADGKLYLGSDGDGIYIVDQNRTSRLGTGDGLTSEVILRIKKDPKEGFFWIITSNSLAFMKDQHITTIKNFPYSNNFDLYRDNNDNMWILASNGIYVVDAGQLLSDQENMEYTLYDTKSGLPTETTANSRSAITDDGTLYIAGTSGVTAINIDKAAEETREIKLAVPSIEVDDQLYNVENGSVTIPSGSRRIIIDGYALTFSLQNPKVSYYLEGFDDSPIVSTKQEMQPAIYTNLDGGEYTFHLSTVNTLTGEEQNSIAIRIIKKKALYEYTVVQISLVILLIAVILFIVWMYFRKRTERLERKAEEDRKFIAQLSKTFAKCIDIKDTYTNGHSFRVAKYTGLIAEKLGYSEAETEKFYNIALLHDIGKIGIPDRILNKPERLNDEEYQEMKSHPEKGYQILSDFQDIEPEFAYGAGYHHERFDGKGYPKGLKGEDIPKVAQIIAVADTFDAMYSTRPYRKKLPLETVVGEIKRIAGTQLNPEIVDAFIALYEEHVFDNE